MTSKSIGVILLFIELLGGLGMGKKIKLNDAEWDKLIDDGLKKLASSATKKRGSAAKLAKILNKSRSSIVQMKTMAKGSTSSWIRLLFYKADIDDLHAKEIIENLDSILLNITPPSQLDKLYERLKELYSEQEVAALFRVLISKSAVEEFLGIKKESTRMIK